MYQLVRPAGPHFSHSGQSQSARLASAAPSLKLCLLSSYSRVVKSSILSVGEKNLVAVSSAGIEEVGRIAQGINVKRIAAGISEAATKSSAQPSTKRQFMYKRCRQFLQDAQRNQTALPSTAFSLRVGNVFGFKDVRAAEWNRLAQPLIRAYKIAVNILERPSPHLDAYHSALNAAFRAVRSSSRNDHAAMINAKRAVGAPPPGGKQKYAVQSMAHLVRIKHQLAELASEFAAQEQVHGDAEFAFRFRYLGHVLLQSALQDALIARHWAAEASLTRQALLGNVLVFRSQLLLFRHDSVSESKVIGTSSDRRQALFERSERTMEESYQEVVGFIESEVDKVFLRNENEVDWLEDNVNTPLKNLREDWC